MMEVDQPVDALNTVSLSQFKMLILLHFGLLISSS